MTEAPTEKTRRRGSRRPKPRLCASRSSSGTVPYAPTRAHASAPRSASGAVGSAAGPAPANADTAARLRPAFGSRRDRFRARLDADNDGAIEEQSAAYQRVMRQLLDAEHAALLALRNDGVINDAVMQRVQRDIDLEAARLDQ